MSTIIFITLSIASSALAALRIFWIEANFNIETVATYMLFQSLLMLAAYADLGLNQGVLYRSIRRTLKSRERAAASIINGMIKKATLLCIFFFILYYPIFLGLTKNVLSILQVTILCSSYIISLALVNFNQVYLRTFDYLVPLATFNFLVSSVALVIMISVDYTVVNSTVFILLASQPLSILIVLATFIFLGFYKKLDLSVKSYPWFVVCNISLSGIYIAIIGILYGFFVIMDKVYIARVTNINGSAVYVFFTVFAAIAITLSGFAYQAGFRHFFSADGNTEYLKKNINLLLQYFFGAITPLYIIFFLIIVSYVNNFQSEYFEHVRFIPLVLLVSFNSVFIGFANQYLLANYQHKIICLYNVVMLGGIIVLTEILFQYGVLISANYFTFCASVVGLVYMMILIIKAGASVWNVFYNVMIFGAGLAFTLAS